MRAQQNSNTLLSLLATTNSGNLALFAGPCAIVGTELLDIADKIAESLEGLPITWVFKASFDKANRTSLRAERVNASFLRVD